MGAEDITRRMKRKIKRKITRNYGVVGILLPHLRCSGIRTRLQAYVAEVLAGLNVMALLVLQHPP
jgi:hypothetical protein